MKTLTIILVFFLCSTQLIAPNLYAKESRAPQDSENVLQVAQLNADFAQLYSDLKSSHINLFANVSQEDYDQKYVEIKQLLNKPLEVTHAQVLFQQFVAYGQIAHAYISFPNEAYEAFRNKGGKAFPIYVEINQGKWFISEDYSSLALPIGTEITHIDGKTVAYWLDKLHQYISADTPAIAASLLEFQLPQYLWLVDIMAQETPTASRESIKVSFVINQKTETFDVNFVSRETLQTRIEKTDTPNKETSDKLRDYSMLTDKLAYLKPGPFYNSEEPTDVWNNKHFVGFVDKAFQYFIENSAKALVIDIRNNPGGTNSFSDPLIAWYANKPFKFASDFLVKSSYHAKMSNQKRLAASTDSADMASISLAKSYDAHPFGTTFSFSLDEAQPRTEARFTGDVYVLINRSSYSNAVSLAAITQDYDFGKIIGEPSADFATTYASMEHFTLEHSNIQVGFPKAHIIRPSGDKKPGPVLPDIYLDDMNLDKIISILSEK